MGVSHYFNNYAASKINEIKLYEDVIVESIKIMGHNVYYMPRESYANNDNIFGENTNSKFDRAYLVEMYLNNVEGWEGDGDFFSKFGLEIRDNTNLIIAKRTFEKYIPSSIATRPREGDFVFIPVMNKLFEIKFVEEELLFFTRGNKHPYIYELRCEAVRYSETEIDLNTGVDIIDDIEAGVNYTVVLTVANTSNLQIGESVYQGGSFATANSSGKISNIDQGNNTIFVTDIIGTFNSYINITSTVSNTTVSLSTVDTKGDSVYYDVFDNEEIQTEANSFIDLSETNPFGMP